MLEAELVHHIPGRMRLRVPAGRRNPELMQEVVNSIQKLRGVLDVSGNALLGTLIVQYDPALSGEAIQLVTEHAASSELFLLRPLEPEDPHSPVSQLDRAVDQFFDKVNRTLHAATGNTVNLKEVFPAGILIYALFFLDKATAASQWWNWVQFALSTYLEVHEGEPIVKVGDSVEALREELKALREELRTHFKDDRKETA